MARHGKYQEVRTQMPAIERHEVEVEKRGETLEERRERLEREFAKLQVELNAQAKAEAQEAEARAAAELHASRYWPEGAPMPTVYVKQIIPCPKCGRIRTDFGSIAVRCQSSGKDKAWFRCSCCDATFSMPVSDKT